MIITEQERQRRLARESQSREIHSELIAEHYETHDSLTAERYDELHRTARLIRGYRYGSVGSYRRSPLTTSQRQARREAFAYRS